MGKVATIYLITNKINNKKYVGFTTLFPFKKRWDVHVSQSKSKKHSDFSNIYLLNAIRKYGPNSFTIKSIYEDDKIFFARDVMEEFFIRKLGTHFSSGNGYNMTYGGEGTIGFKKTPEQIEAMRKRNIGKKMSEESKQKLRIAFSGKNNPNYGKKHTEEIRKKISKALTGKKISSFFRRP